MAKTKLALYDNEQISFFKADQLAVSALAYIKNTAGNLVMQAESTGKLNFKSSLLLDTGLTIGSAGSSSTLTIGNSGDIINLNASGVTYNIGTLTGSPTFTGNITTQGSGTNTFSGTTIFSGTVNFNGTTAELNVTTLTIDDKNIELGSIVSPTDALASGGGITLKGTTDKTIIWDDPNDNWTSSEHWNLATGKLFKINNTTLFGYTDPYTISYQKFMIYGVRTSQNTSTEAFRISAFPADNQNYANNAFHIGFWDNNEQGGVGGANLAEAARISVKREEGWGALATRSAGFEFSTVLDGTLAPRVIISASGNLGIGTTSAASVLDLGAGTGGRSIVWGGPSGAAHYASIGTMHSSAHLFIGSALKLDTTAANILYSYSGTQAASGITFNFASGDITFLAEAVGAKTAGAVFNQTTNAKMIIRPSGNVGIGTLTPGAKFEILQSGGAWSGGLRINNSGLSGYWDIMSDPDLRIGGNDTARLIIKQTTGNVGIGTTSPVEKLEVNGNVKALSALLTGLSSYAVPYKSASTSYLENSAISYNPTNNFVGFNWTTMSRMIVWPNIYDTRANTYNAFLNSGDMLVNLVQRGGSVTVHNGLGPISEIEVYRTGLSTSTVINGGSGYAVNDVLTVVGGDNNATVTVASIDGSGKVLTVTITSAGTNYLTGPNISVTGGAGTGCKLYIKTVTGSARDATSYHSNLIAGSIFKPALSAPYWSSVTIANPVQVTIDLGGSIHMYRMMLIPGGRNQMPINYTIETYANDSYYGLARWHTQKTAVAESNTYIKLVEFTTQSEAILKIRITVTVSGDYDYTNTFSIQQLIGYERYIGNGRFTGYNMAVTGDTAYGDYIINGYVRATTNFLSGAGTVSSPAFTFINDSDTGIFNPTANTLAFSTLGSERVRINSSGYVGIGVTSPTILLDVRSASSSMGFGDWDGDAALYLDGADGDRSGADYTIFRSKSTGALDIYAPTLTVSVTSGKVGIGTATPNDLLHVSKDQTDFSGIRVSNAGTVDANTRAGIRFGEAIGNDYAEISWFRSGTDEFRIWNKVATGDITFRVNAGEAMRIDQAGKIGMGTALPQSKLHIVGDPTNASQPSTMTNSTNDLHTGLFINGSGNATSEKYGIQFGNYYQYGFAGIYSIMTSTSGTTIGDLTFETKGTTSDATLSERMRITSSGDVGIGTASPGSRLHLKNTTAIVRLLIDSGDGTTKYDASLSWQDNNQYAWTMNKSGSNNFEMLRYVAGVYQDKPIEITNSNGDMKLNAITAKGSSGYVGIGTSSPGVPLGVVKSDTGTTLGSSGVVLNVANVHNTTNNIAAISFGNSGGGAGWSQIGAIYKDRTGGSEDQDLFFRVIAAGSSSEVMRISNALRVGIGTNDPLTKLHVYDSVAGGLLTIQGVTGGQGFGLSLLNSAGTAYIRLLNDNGNLRIQTNTADHIINLKAAGSIGLGTESQSTSNRLSVNGAVAIGSGYISTAAPVNGLLVEGNVGIGKLPEYKLDVAGDTNISGHLYASVKHFRAEDPTNPNHYITYSSLEGPENAVFYRGKVNIKDNIYIIKLPKEWEWLVDQDSLSVYLTSEDDDQHLSYSIYNDTIKIKNNKMLSKHIKCSYLIMATRKDIKPLVVHT